MKANRLADRSETTVHKTVHDYCDFGNEHLKQIKRDHEIRWVLRNGRPTLEWLR